MLPRPALPERANHTRTPAGSGAEANWEEEGWAPPQTKRRVREVGQARNDCVSHWAAAAQLISAQPGLTWHIKLQINLVY